MNDEADWQHGSAATDVLISGMAGDLPGPAEAGATEAIAVRRRVGAAVLTVLAVAAGVALLWRFVAWALVSDRGIDPTDESLYLLAADPPRAAGRWGFPWGWHTGPLLRLVRHDTADFRTLGGVLLVAAGASLGWLVTRCCAAPSLTRRGALAWRCAGAVAGAVGVLLYYGALLRSPSYNWLNLFGMIVALAGALVIAVQTRHRWSTNAAVAVTAFGLFVTTPAKPTSPIAGAVIIGCLLWRTRGLAVAFRMTGLLCVAVLGWVLVAVASGMWPTNFLGVFWDAAHAPTLVSGQSMPGAISTSELLPEELLAALRNSGRATRTAIALTAGALGLAARKRDSATFGVLPLALAAVAAVLAMDAPHSIVSAGVARDRWVDQRVSLGLVLLLGGTWAVRRLSGGVQNRNVTAVFPAALALVVVFGFGSGHGLLRQSALASGLIVAAVLAIAVSIADVRRRAAAVATVLLVATCASVAVLADSRLVPERMAPLSAQTELIRLGRSDRSIRVDAGTAGFVHDLRTVASEGGWQQGTPLLGLAWRWNSFVPYVLGADTPSSLMITLFGNPGSVAQAQHNLQAARRESDWDGAWLVVPSGPIVADMSVDQAAQWQAVLELVEGVTGRDFSTDYHCVGTVQSIELWAPGAVPGRETCPAPGLITFDFHRGYRR